jgi:hypothetical protein
MVLILEEVMGFVKRNSPEARRWNGVARVAVLSLVALF